MDMMKKSSHEDVFKKQSTSEMNDDQWRIVNYLRDAINSGRRYFKSKHMAEEIGGLTAKSVGSNMAILRSLEPELNLHITAWGRGARSTTWKVEIR